MQRVAYAEWALAEYFALFGRPEALKHARRAIKGCPTGRPKKSGQRIFLKLPVPVAQAVRS